MKRCSSGRGECRAAHLPLAPLAEQTTVMPAIHRRWTTADVRALQREQRAWPRYELIGGDLLVTPAPGWAHQIAVTEIWSLINAHLQHVPVGIAVTSPADLELRPETVTQPDVFVVPADIRASGGELQWSDVTALLLAVEVLSPGSAHTDRVEKRTLYLESNVAEYWIVDLEARVVERWTAACDKPEILGQQLAWQSGAGEEPLVIGLPALFERVASKCRTITR